MVKYSGTREATVRKVSWNFLGKVAWNSQFFLIDFGYLFMSIWCKVEWWQTDLSWNLTGSDFPRPQWHKVQGWSSLFAFVTQLSSVMINWWDCADYRHRWNHQPIFRISKHYRSLYISSTSRPLNRALTHQGLRLQGVSRPHESSVDFAKQTARSTRPWAS